ncbi:MAG: alpha/beta fold hydrolase, partial [Cyanobacteria bacterium P01_A01_bin.70]
MSFCLQQKVLTNEISLAYREQGTGEAVVMLHGLADHGLVWQSLAAHLSDRYRCLAPDLRGHGNSSKPPESAYDSQVLAADLEGWAEAL